MPRRIQSHQFLAIIVTVVLLQSCAQKSEVPSQLPATQTHQDSYKSLGESFYKQRKFKDAIPALREAVKRNPKDKDAWFMLGMSVLGSGGAPDEALNAFERANALDPGNWEIAENYVTTAELTERYRLALYVLDLLQEYNDEVIVTERFNEIWNEAMVQAREDHKKRPHDAVPYGYAAYLYMAKGNVDAAQKTVDEGFKMRNGKEVPTLWRVKADIEARQHKYEQALADYDMAIKVFRKPANVQRDLGSQITHLHRQRVLKELGRTDQTSDAPTFSEHR